MVEVGARECSIARSNFPDHDAAHLHPSTRMCGTAPEKHVISVEALEKHAAAQEEKRGRVGFKV